MDPEAERRLIEAQADAIIAKHDDRILAELHRLEAEVRRIKFAALAPRQGVFRLLVRDLETNPHAQYSVHKWGAWYWLLNFPAVTALFFFQPDIWLKWGLYITLIYSIYANFSTDYSGMSAAMAAYGDNPLPEIPMSIHENSYEEGSLRDK